MLLVLLQFSLLLGLAALAAPNAVQGEISVAAWLLVLASLALMAWTLGYNRIGNFNIRPIPKLQGQLITSGPYRWIRHPMYTAAILGGLAMALVGPHSIGLALCLCLVLVLWFKSRVEERWMLMQHAGYAHYRLHSKGFLPWLI